MNSLLGFICSFYLEHVTYLANFTMHKNEFKREIVVFQNFFWEFYKGLDKNSQKKIEWTLGLVRDLPIIPIKYFKSIEGTKGLYELRIQVGSNAYRIFCCLDSGNKAILLNGYVKKSPRIPRKVLLRAIRIKKKYFNETRNSL